MALQTTADGPMVLTHEYAVTRHDGTLSLVHATIASDCGLATLDELIELCQELRIGLYFEIEDEPASRVAPEIIRRHHFDLPVYASFRPDWIANARAVADAPCETAILFASRSVDPVQLASPPARPASTRVGNTRLARPICSRHRGSGE